MNKQAIIVDITISEEEYLKYYQGSARTVSCLSIDGQRVEFPANILQQFVSHHGISGRFKIEFSPQHKFLNIIKI